jgi:hypothetical protein
MTIGKEMVKLLRGALEDSGWRACYSGKSERSWELIVNLWAFA